VRDRTSFHQIRFKIRIGGLRRI